MASRHTVFSNLSETISTLANVGCSVEKGIWLVRTLITEISILGAIAHALESNLGETWSASALVRTPDGVGDNRASVLVDSFAGSASVKASFGAHTSFSRSPDFLVGTGNTVIAVVDLSRRADASQIG